MKSNIYKITFIIISSVFILLSFILSSKVFAQGNNMPVVDGIKNVMSDAENTIENAGNSVASGMRNMTSGMENRMNDMSNTMTDTFDNNNYSATRTSTEVNGSFMGMGPMAWTWLIIGMVGVAIIALVWFYAKQNNHSYNE